MSRYNKFKEELITEGYTLIKSEEFFLIKKKLIKSLKHMAMIIISKSNIQKNLLNDLQDLEFQELINWCIKNETNNCFSQKFSA